MIRVGRIARSAGAAEAYLATLRGAEQANTRRVYGRTPGKGYS